MLTAEWPDLEPLEPKDRDRLRQEHRQWQERPAAHRDDWIAYILGDLLGWHGNVQHDDLAPLARLTLDVPEHETAITPSFHDTRQGPRYTIGAAVRQEILDCLLELNHERYAAEVKAGLHDKRGLKRAAQASDTNSVLHSASRDGGEFTLRAEVHKDHVLIEVEDVGGPWRAGLRENGHPHGLDLVAAIAGPRNWGIDGGTHGRTAWARLSK